MSPRLLRLLLIFAAWLPTVCVLTGARPVYALGGPENVLVVQNGNSPVSVRIAAYYMSARSIPSGNLVTVYTPDSSVSSSNELISPQNYQTLIEQPIRSYLSSRDLTDQIQFIVLTKGVPHRLSFDPTGGQYGGQSVDSMLAGIDLVNPLPVQFADDSGTVVATAYANRYWRSSEPFTHARYGGYLVTRLDGYTEADAKALVDRAMAPQQVPYRLLLDIDYGRGLGDPSVQPKSILLPDGTLDPDYSLDYPDYNADMTRAAQVTSGRPYLSIELDSTSAFVGSPYPLSGYVSWGSNDSSFSLTTYNSLTFSSGGIAETAVSSSGRTFLPTTGGQSLIADLIAQGASGGKGYVTEPFLDAIASPTVLFDLYTSGRNLAESYYAASRFVEWKDVVLGDPLCCLKGTAAQTVASAKSLPDGSLVSLPAETVTVGTDDFGNRFYIEDQDRSSGIQVNLVVPFPGITEGMTVSVRGIVSTVDGERVISNASVVTE